MVVVGDGAVADYARQMGNGQVVVVEDAMSLPLGLTRPVGKRRFEWCYIRAANRVADQYTCFQRYSSSISRLSWLFIPSHLPFAIIFQLWIAVRCNETLV